MILRVLLAAGLLAAGLLAGCVTVDAPEPQPESARVLDGLFEKGARPDVLQAPIDPWAALRQAYDRDGNGEITPAELVDRDFQRFDRNRDGAVNLQDFPVESGELPSWLFQKLERGTAQRSLALVLGASGGAQSWQGKFRALDRNGDLNLDRPEFEAGREAPGPARSDGFSALLNLVDMDQNDQLGWLELTAALGAP
jgi:Ca2+-binding EF-hand superfamily protein